MKYTGERQIPSVPGTLIGLDPKHVQRYEFASIFTDNKSVYDIASGAGYGSMLLKASQYTGFDNSSEATDYANTYYGNQNARFIQADACNMPDMSNVDVIVSFETIEHIPNPEALLSWCARTSELLIISSPIRGSFGKSHFHLFEYTLKEFENVLEKYFSKVHMYIQNNSNIIFPCAANDRGVAVAICRI